MYKNIFNLKGKTAIVTGGAGLIGKEVCRGLGEFGANVIIGDTNKKKGNTIAKKINRYLKSKKIYYKYLDITSENSVEEFVKNVISDFGKIDILVNCAYPKNDKFGTAFEEIEFESYKENVIGHMGGYFLMTQQVAKTMIEQRNGVIVNMGSIYGMVGPDFSIYKGTGMDNAAEYSMIKGGIINFTRYLATRLAPYNIRVNTLSPGGVYDNQPKLFVKRYVKKTPLGRMANPGDIVGPLIFLVSDASKYITGQNIAADGGWTAW